MSVNPYSKFLCESNCFCDFFLSFLLSSQQGSASARLLGMKIYLIDSASSTDLSWESWVFLLLPGFFWVLGKSSCQSTHTLAMVNKVLFRFPTGNITCFGEYSSAALPAVPLKTPVSLAVSFTVGSVHLGAFVMCCASELHAVVLKWCLCFCFSFYLWFTSSFWKEKGVRSFSFTI